MKAKWLKIMLIIMSVTLLVGLVACSDRSNDDFTPDNVGEPDEKDTVYTVAVFNDTLYNVNYYLAGQTVILTSKQVPGKQFVRWEIDGEALSYQEQTTYTVERNAVIKAIYVTTGMVEVEDVLDAKFTVEFDSDKSIESGVLYNGYHFSVTTPTKQYYTFMGYYNENGTKITDYKGKSIIAYDGSFNKLVPQFSENDFVNIVIKNGETNEVVKEQKWYVEDGEYEALAGNVVDRQCVGWVNAKGEEVSTGATLSVAMKGLTSGETYEFTAKYREAYKLMVISGYGSGAYAKEDKVNLSCTAPVGKEFLYWEITDGEKVYTLGVKTDGEKEYLGLIDGENFVYYDGKQKLTQDNLDDVTKLGKKYDFLMGDLEKMGVEIVGKQTIISAVFNKVIFFLTYKLDHMVDGVSALDEETVDTLKALGFVDNNGVFEKVVEYEYNDAISLINIPEVDNYSFERWQSATGSAIPTTMPQEDIELVGTFKANKYNVTVVSPANGTVKIGSGGNTTSGYYSYNSTIKIFVTADLGYEFDRWRNIEDVVITLAEVEREEGETISYVFEYVVKEKQRFTVDFDTREYTIFYSTSVWYDGKDVTDDVEYFDNYQQGYNQFTEKVKFGNVNTALLTQPTTSSMGLIYADYWNVTNWVITDEDGNVDMNINSSNFTMPSYNLYAHCDYKIKNYRMSLSGNVGVESYAIRTINEKNAETYLTDSENLTYTVPYGADVLADVKYNVGYDKGDVIGDSIVIDGHNANLTMNKTTDYTYEVAFKMLLSKNTGIAYSLYSTQNKHTLSYYVNVDYDNVDPELNLFDYLGVDATDTVEHDGKVYHRLLTTDDGVETKQLTVSDYVYDQKIDLFTFDSSIVANNRYKFNNWNKVHNGKAYGGTNMPDGDVYAYGDMVLDSFTLSIGTGKFEFDGDPTASVKTASDTSFTQDGQEGQFSDGGTYRYYSSITVEPILPTGYDFVQWQASTRSQSGAITNTTLNLDGEGLQKQDGYYYENNPDGSLTVYLTKNVTISATFKKKTFSLKIERSEVMVQKEGTIGEYYTSSDEDIRLEYGTYLTIVLNRSRILDGYKVSNINVENADGVELSTVAVPMNTDYYYYEQEEFEPDDYYVREDVVINPVVEKIKYTMTYVVYSALNDVHQWRSDTEYSVLTDASYVIELNENKVLMKEEELNARLTAIGVSTDNLMYSGWFSELNADATEGEGFIQDRQYTSSKSYKHSIKDANATFYCYLIEEYDFATSGSGVEISINDVIKMTPAYNSYFTETRKELILPSENNGKSVVTVGDFAQMVGVEEVTIPSEVAVIKENAFSECAGLSTVNYNQKLTAIGKKAFFGCVKLTSDATTNIPEFVTGIGESAFDGCASIEEIVLSNRISAVHDKAFANQPKLREVVIDGQYLTFESTIGNGIFSLSGAETEGGFDVKIGENASYVHANFFRSDANADFGKYLGDVVIEDGTKSIEIGANAFRNSGLRSIALNGRITKVTEYAFFGCKNLEGVDLSSTLIAEIEHSLFRQSGIKEVIMPASITSIGAYAFAGCDKMESLYYTAKSDGTYGITTINMGAFQFESSGAKNTIKRFVDVSARESVLVEPSAHALISIPEGTIKILDNAFHSCIEIEALIIPSTITTIGADAFYNSSALKSIVYNAIATADLVSGTPFGGAGAEGLTLTIGDAVTNIPAQAFNGMRKLSSVTLPEGLQSIGTNAFANITYLKEINYKPVNLEDVEESIFAGSGAASGITVNIHVSVEELPAFLFYGAGMVREVNILSSATRKLSIRENAFSGVSGLAELVWPQMAELTIKSNAFENANVQKVTFSEEIQKITIESGALSANDNYKRMTLNYAGTEVAGESAFLNAGVLVSTKQANGYATEITGGELSIGKDVVISDYNSLALISTVAEINYGELRVAGELTIDGGSLLRRTAGQGLAVAIPRDESNVIAKANSNAEYDVLEIDREITVDGAIGVEFDEVRITNDAKLTVNGSIGLVATNRVVVDGEIYVIGQLELICEREKLGEGVIEVGDSSQAVVKIDDNSEEEIKTYVDNVASSALSISEGTVKIYPIVKEFVIESGAIVTAENEFVWEEDEVFTVNGTFINNADTYVNKFVMSATASVIVNERLTLFSDVIGTYPQISDESKIKAGVNREDAEIDGTAYVYYKDLYQAFGDDLSAKRDIVFNVREDVTATESVEIKYDAEVKLNGKTYTYNGNNEAFALEARLVIGGGTIDAENGTAFMVSEDVSIEGSGLDIFATIAFLTGGGVDVTLNDNEITAQEIGISILGSGATVNMDSVSILATVGIEAEEGTTATITRSTIEASDSALYLTTGVVDGKISNKSEITINNTNLSSASAQATISNKKATIYVGHVAKVTVVNIGGERVVNESGTAVLVDNSFIPDRTNAIFKQEGGEEQEGQIDYNSYISLLTNLFYVDVAGANVTGEVAEVVRGRYAEEHANRVKVKNDDVAGLTLSAWSGNTVNYAKYVNNADNDTAMSNSNSDSPYVALGSIVEFNVNVTESNVIVADNASEIIIRAQEIAGTIRAKQVTSFTISENATITSTAIIGENKLDEYSTEFVVIGGKELNLESSIVPIDSILSSGTMNVKANIGLGASGEWHVDVTVEGEMNIESGYAVRVNNVEISSEHATLINNGELFVNEIDNEGTFTTNGSMEVVKKLINKGTYRQDAPVIAGEIESIGTFTMGVNTATLMVIGNLTMSKTFDAIADVSVGGIFTMNSGYTMTIASGVTVEAVEFISAGMLETSGIINVKNAFINNGTLTNNGTIAVLETVTNNGTYRENGELTAKTFYNADTKTDAKVTISNDGAITVREGGFSNHGVLDVYGTLDVFSYTTSGAGVGGFVATLNVNEGATIVVDVDIYNLSGSSTIAIKESVVLTATIYNEGKLFIEQSSNFAGIENSGEIEIAANATVTLNNATQYSLGGKLWINSNGKLSASMANKIEFSSGSIVVIYGTIENFTVYLQSNVVIVDPNDTLALYDSASINEATAEELTENNGYVRVELLLDGNAAGIFAKYTHKCNVTTVAPTCGVDGYSTCDTEAVNLIISDAGLTMSYSHDEQFDIQPATGDHYYTGNFSYTSYEDENGSGSYTVISAEKCANCTTMNGQLVVLNKELTEIEALERLASLKQTETSGSGWNKTTITRTIVLVGYGSDMALSDMAQTVSVGGVEYQVVMVTVNVESKPTYGSATNTEETMYVVIQ